MAENGNGAAPVRKLHISMFPWLAFGHMIPYLQLSKLIARKGHHVSFLSSPYNIDRLVANLKSSPDELSDAASTIDFVKLPLRHHLKLPENAEATSDVPHEEVHYLFESFDLLQDEVCRFLQSSKPDWILHECNWIREITRQLGIKSAHFSVFKATSMVYLAPPKEICGFEDYRREPEHFTVPPKWIPFPCNIAMRRHEIVRTFDNVKPDNTGIAPLDRVKEMIRDSDSIFVRTCYELESKYLDLLETLFKKPVIPVGLLPAVIAPSDSEEGYSDIWNPIRSWLDEQMTGSVIYVAFGSETKLRQEEATQIALGLELCALPFIWAIKTRRGPNDTEMIVLPKGFQERVNGRGMICTSWVPQQKLLSHSAIGGLFFHSGWSTVIEAIQFGKTMVVLPLQSDQPLVARFLEAERLGYCLPRNEEDGSFTKEAVAESLRLVMVDEAGKTFRDKVLEMKGLFGDMDLQDSYIDALLEHILASMTPVVQTT